MLSDRRRRVAQLGDGGHPRDDDQSCRERRRRRDELTGRVPVRAQARQLGGECEDGERREGSRHRYDGAAPHQSTQQADCFCRRPVPRAVDGQHRVSP